jgi:hypothetical protein
LDTQEKAVESLPNDCHHYTKLLLKIYNPRFSIARYAAELDIQINQVYVIVDHLIYWAKVKIIYPISESNVYVIHPNAPLYIGSRLAKEFSEFVDNPDITLSKFLARFSYAHQLVDHLGPNMTKESQVT